MTRYIGIDLAWGGRTTTAAVVLEGVNENPRDGARYVDMVDDLTDDDSIIAFIRSQDGGENILVGIDAPTVVPNATGRRPCEAVLARCLRRQEAGPHPANRGLLARDGSVRGERLVARLEEYGILHTPYVSIVPGITRAVFEVFPHPAHIALFGLERTLKYKAKPDRTREQRLSAYRRYTHLLEGLREADPPLLLPQHATFWLRRDPSKLGTAALKRHEDALDAITCAYVALYRLVWGALRCPAVGDLRNGYIVTPASEEMRECFTEVGKEVAAPVA
jgi:predicted RNase H-like nuclease